MLKRALCATAALALFASPACADMMLMDIGDAPFSTYLAPAITNPYVIAFGDSRARSAAGPSFVGTSPTKSATYSETIYKGWSGWIPWLSNNRVVFSDGYDYGVDSQSTVGFAGRLSRSGNDCNLYSNYSNYWCFTASYAQTSGAFSSGVTVITTTAAPTITTANVAAATFTANGSNVWFSAASAPQTTNVVTGNSGATSFTNSAGLFGSLASGAYVAFVPYSLASNFQPYLQGSSAGTTVDINNNVASLGVYSVITDPAQVVFMNGGNNDTSMVNTSGASGNPGTLKNWDAILNAFGPTGANKIVIAGNEAPFGLATGYSAGNTSYRQDGDPEVHTVPSSTGNCGSGAYQVTGVYCVQVIENTVGSVSSQTIGAFFMEPNPTAVTWQAGGPLPVLLAPCASNTSGTPATGYQCGTGAAADGTHAFIAAAGDGTALTPDSSAHCTASPPAPVAGTFCVNAQGVYTFNAAQAGAHVAIYYRFVGFDDASPAVMEMINGYFNAALTVGPGSLIVNGTAYNSDSARYGRPWVHVADLWDADMDANIPNNCLTPSYCWNKAFTSIEGAHYTPYGAAVTAQAMVAAAVAAGAIASPTPVISPPTVLSPLFVGAGVSSTGAHTYSASLCPSISGATANYWITGLSPSITGLTQAQAQALYPAGHFLSSASATAFDLITGAGGHAIQVDCWDTVNNQVHVTPYGASSFAGFTANTGGVAWMDHVTTNLLPDGLFCVPGGTLCPNVAAGDASYVNTSAITGCGTGNYLCPAPVTGNSAVQGFPGHASYLTLDTASQAALGNYTLGLAFGMEKNPLGDGYDAWTIQAQGYAGLSGTGSVDVPLPVLLQDENAMSSGDWHRLACEVAVSAGPNGHLYGLSDFSLLLGDNSSSPFTAPGDASASAANAYKTWGASAANSAVAAFSDASLQTGAPGVQTSAPNILYPGGQNTLVIPVSSPPTQLVNSGASNTTTFSIFIHWMGYDPQSWTLRIERCGVFKTNSIGSQG